MLEVATLHPDPPATVAGRPGKGERVEAACVTHAHGWSKEGVGRTVPNVPDARWEHWEHWEQDFLPPPRLLGLCVANSLSVVSDLNESIVEYLWEKLRSSSRAPNYTDFVGWLKERHGIELRPQSDVVSHLLTNACTSARQPISAVVVAKATGIPGNGFWRYLATMPEYARPTGDTTGERKKVWKGLMADLRGKAAAQI